MNDVIVFANSQYQLLLLWTSWFESKTVQVYTVQGTDFFPWTFGFRSGFPQQDKSQAIQDWHVPKYIRDVRTFFGLAYYYRKFATTAEPFLL